jgi:hypothetical protein
MNAAAANATPRLQKLLGNEMRAAFFFLASWLAIGLSVVSPDVEVALSAVEAAVGPAVEVAF